MHKKLLSIILVFVCIFCSLIIFTGCKGNDGGETKSISRIYDDTDGESQEVSIWIPNSDATSTGDNIKLSKKSPDFTLNVKNVDTTESVYIFIDGDIDFPVYECIPAKPSFALSLTAPKSKLKEGEHIVQVVQFDGEEPSFCKTVHYIVEVEE